MDHPRAEPPSCSNDENAHGLAWPSAKSVEEEVATEGTDGVKRAPRYGFARGQISLRLGTRKSERCGVRLGFSNLIFTVDFTLVTCLHKKILHVATVFGEPGPCDTFTLSSVDLSISPNTMPDETSNDVRQASLDHTLAGMSALSNPATVTDETHRAHALLQLAISLIDSALDILGKHILTDQQLQHASVLMPGGTVGKHFRHVRLTPPLLVKSAERGIR